LDLERLRRRTKALKSERRRPIATEPRRNNVARRMLDAMRLFGFGDGRRAGRWN
jgi:hypothetical protein